MKNVKVVPASMLALSLLVSVSACGVEQADSATPKAGVTGSAQEKHAADIEVVENGYSMTDDGYMYYGFIIENPSEDTAYEFPRVIITAYDDNGDVLATSEQVMNKIQPGEKQAFGSVMDCNGQTPAKVEFIAENGNKISPSDKAIKSSDFEISGTNERAGEFGDISVTGTVKNNSDSDTTSVGMTVLFKKDGQIVYGSTTYVDNLSAGKEKPFEFSEFNVPDHDIYEVYAHDWGF